jgi:hypothetical protein
MPDACRQQLGPAVDSPELLVQHGSQLPRVLGREVRQPAVFGVLPHHLVRVRLGGVTGEFLGGDLGVLLQVGPHHLRAVVDISPIPQDRHRPGNVLPQLLQKLDGILTVDVGIVGQQAEAQPQPLRFALTVTALMAKIRSWRSTVRFSIRV